MNRTPSHRSKDLSANDQVIQYVKEKSHQLTNEHDLDPLLERIGDARIVMLGESTHGTHEYYTWRSYISRRLIREKHFNFIAVEADWPDAYKLNRYIKNYDSEAKQAIEVLKHFDRWPTWMWANWEIAAVAEWLKDHNKHLPKTEKVGFYGLDVYSLWDSLEAIRDYLKKTDPAALQKAEEAFRCFEPYKEEGGSSYAYASRLVPQLCEDEVVTLLSELQGKSPQFSTDYENVFSTEQNALVAVNAEKYYRSMLGGSAESWNIRDGHMQETLERLLEFHGPHSKAIVWEHNTHIGDARATDMSNDGMFNIGELARKRFSNKEVVLVGFGSYKGTVVAAKNWGAPMQRMAMPVAKQGSWEDILQKAGMSNNLLIMDDFTNPFFQNYISHRAIGVVYRPEYESYGNYVPSILPERYDAFIFINETSALHALHKVADGHLVPDTYPFGV